METRRERLIRHRGKRSHEEIGDALSGVLGRKIGKGTVWKWEQVDEPNIDLEVFFALADLYKVDARELAIGERTADAQGSLELTPTARTIARIWDQMPPTAQEYLTSSLDNVFRLFQEDPDVAALIFARPTDRKRTRDHEKLIEAVQAKSRKRK